MAINDKIIDRIIQKIILSQNYRIEILNLINAEFLDFVMEFFQKIAVAKIANETIDSKWYKDTFLSPDNSSDEIAIYAGLNKKSITNMYKSATKQIVLEVAHDHFDSLLELINELSTHQNEIDLELSIRFGGITAHLNISESMLIINVIAVKRASIRGSLWSALGKNVEKKLMLRICELFAVPEQNYSVINIDTREVDFYFIDNEQRRYNCEIKLMGKGNPESADAVIARNTHVFIADTLSDMNKQQLSSLTIHWIELGAKNGVLKFNDIFSALNIPYKRLINLKDPMN